MIKWRTGKAGFVGSLKYFMKSVFTGNFNGPFVDSEIFGSGLGVSGRMDNDGAGLSGSLKNSGLGTAGSLNTNGIGRAGGLS